MSIWIVEVHLDYESGHIVGVFSSFEKAKENAQNAKEKMKYIHAITISKWETDQGHAETDLYWRR